MRENKIKYVFVDINCRLKARMVNDDEVFFDDLEKLKTIVESFWKSENLKKIIDYFGLLIGFWCYIFISSSYFLGFFKYLLFFLKFTFLLLQYIIN